MPETSESVTSSWHRSQDDGIPKGAVAVSQANGRDRLAGGHQPGVHPDFTGVGHLSAFIVGVIAERCSMARDAAGSGSTADGAADERWTWLPVAGARY